MNISIKVNLFKKQREIIAGMRRFNIVRAGRRLGKTFLATYAMLKFAITHGNSVCWYVASDIATCTDHAIPEFLRLCPPELIRSHNKQTRTIVLFNGAQLCWKTAESADALRGRGIDFLILDECAFWKNGFDLWQDVLSPQLMGRGGRCMFITSPNGSNWFRRLETQMTEAIQNGTTKEWAIFHGTIFDAENITKEEIESKRAVTPQLTWDQEYMAVYVDQIGLVYWEYRPLFNTVKAPPFPIEKLIYSVRGLDWGMDDNTAATWINSYPNGIAYVADEYVANNLDAATQAQRIVRHNPMPIKFSVLDSSCWSRDPAGSSVAKRFAANGLAAMQATREFDSSVSDVKGLIAAGKILVSDHCVNLLRALEAWQHGSHEPDILAAFRYGIAALIKQGKLMPPIRTAAPTNILDYIKQREKDALESQRALAAIQRHRPQAGKLVFRVYNRFH